MDNSDFANIVQLMTGLKGCWECPDCGFRLRGFYHQDGNDGRGARVVIMVGVSGWW